MLTDLTLLRSLFTVLALVTFIAITIWAWSANRKADFDEAAATLLDDAPAGDAK